MEGAKNVSLDDLRARIDEHLLMIEEVLGGMDAFLTRLEVRVRRTEELLGIASTAEYPGLPGELRKIREELEKFKTEAQAGLNLAFREIRRV
jgi:hypothetical protein